MEIKRPDSKQPIPEDAKKVFTGVIFDVYQWEQEMFDGSKAVFEKLKRPDTVAVIPVLPDGKLLLIEEKQPGAEMYVGAPGGRVDEGEDILAAVKRELLEETGYEAEEYSLWYAIQPITKIDWTIYVFIAKGVKKVTEPKADPGEKINILEMSLEDFMKYTLEHKKRGAEVQTTINFLEAKLDPEKMRELKELFKPC